ncbi:hypothetical protein QAD02_018539 [Eretmocerus hayati]|uniref:Uncharacterized protein n=1 Tax=Eretmocerus hayati TaxID=131215 RepID=A0ACC2PHB9_9HYME|nr:hypothetical protein QAD02_018539 [Eretmocerus hayati]
MTPSRRWKLTFLGVLLVWANLVIATHALPRDSKRSQPSGVIIHEAGARKSSSGAVGGNTSRNPPASPVKFVKPGEFHFYTLDSNGQLVKKQMTKQQIQGMIANGGPGTGVNDNLGLHHHHHHHHELGSEPEVSDVVQNVQKVLKDELTKPIKIQTSGSSIPGSVNNEWSQLLPYVLSGSSSDNQDSSPDSSIILPGTDNDQSYIDVVPLESARPASDQYEIRPSYVPEQLVYDKAENKLVSRRPVYPSSEKPISLLGSMHLPVNILEDRYTYTPPTKSKPSKTTRPTTTTVSYKVTMTRPTSIPISNVDTVNKNNSSGGKPTLYIPVSVSSSLLTDSQNKDNFDLDFQILSGLKHRPSYSDVISTQVPQYGSGPSLTTRFPMRTTTKSYDDSQKPTRLSMSSRPTFSDSASTTPRANQQKATTSSSSYTPSPEITTKAAEQEISYPVKNVNPLDGSNKFETSKKPSATYQPISGEQHSSTSENLHIISPDGPVYEPTVQNSVTQSQSTTNIPFSTVRPVYQPPRSTTTQQPFYTPESKSPEVFYEVTPSLYPVYQGLPTHDADIETYTREKDSTPPSSFVSYPVNTDSERIPETKFSSVPKFSTTEKNLSNLNDDEKQSSVLPAESQEKFNGDPSLLLSALENEPHTTKVVENVSENNGQSSTSMNIELIQESIQTTTIQSVIDSRDSISSIMGSHGTEIPHSTHTTYQSPSADLYLLPQESTKIIDSLLKSTENTPIEFSETITPESETSDTAGPIKFNASQNDNAGDSKDPTQSWVMAETTTQSIPLEEILAENDSNQAIDQEEPLTGKKPLDTETESEILALSQKKIIASFDTPEHLQHSAALDAQHGVEYSPTGSVISKEEIKSEIQDEEVQSKIKTPEAMPTTEPGLFIDTLSNVALTERAPQSEQEDKSQIVPDQATSSTKTNPTNTDIKITSEPIPEYTTSPTERNTVTESESSTYRAESISPNLSSQGDEVSTIRVIPIYDDNAPIYKVSSETTNKIPLLDETTIKLEVDAPKETKTPVQSTPTKTTLYVKPFNKKEGHPIFTTQSTSISDSPLPGLGEALNNYMKEYHVSNMPTDNFPTVIYKGSLKDNDLFGGDYLSSTDSLQITKDPYPSSNSPIVDPTYDGIGPLDYQYKSSQNADDIVSLEEDQTLTPATESTVPEIPASTVMPYDGSSDITRLKPEVDEITRVETPIIHLDLANLKPIDKVKPQRLPEDGLSNSSLTRIKTKVPVEDVDKLLAESALLQEQDIPATESYTLPSDYKPPNQIASGLIAGYPTYDNIDSSSTLGPASSSSDITTESKQESTVLPTIQGTTFKTEVAENKVAQYGAISGQNSQGSDNRIIGDTLKSQEQTPMKNEDQASAAAIPEANTELPSAVLSNTGDLEKPNIVASSNDQLNVTFNTPQDKIEDIINQLKDIPTEFDRAPLDVSGSMPTTIIPYTGLQSVTNGNIPTTEEESLTTTLEHLGRTSDDTLVEEQTSIFNTSDSLTTSTRLIEPIPTVQGLTKATSSTPSGTIASLTSTLGTTVTEPATTRKPLSSSIERATKGPIEKIQSTIDKSAGRIHLDDEKPKAPAVKPTEPMKFSMKTRGTQRRPQLDGQKTPPTYPRRPTRPAHRTTSTTPSTKTTVTESSSVKILATERTTVKPIVDSKENETERLTTLQPQNITDENTDDLKKQPINLKEEFQELNSEPVKLEHSTGAIGLDQSSAGQDKDVAEFLNMCNELSFKFWSYSNTGLSSGRSVTLSPFGMISTLAMIFLGARGPTSNQMNDILKLDDVVTFNPHLVFQNITDTVTLARGQGIENAAFVRALFADRLKVRRIIPFYKEQAQQFYEGAVVDINFSTAGDILRRRTNLLIRKQTGGRIKDFMKTHTISLHSPLTALSANVFQTSCEGPDASVEGRDGEMYFAVAQTVKQRKLVPIPAVVWKSGVSAGYEPSLDATAIALGDSKRPVSLVMVMPGQQGVTASGDNLEKLETRLFNNPSENMNKLLKVIVPRKLEVQMPKFSHRSVVNVTAALKRMGFEQLFTRSADLKGINGAGHDLFLADMVQMNLFCTCSDDNKAGGRHLTETYPGTSSRNTHKENSNVSELKENTTCDDVEETGAPINPRQNLTRNRIKWLTKRRLCRHRRQAESEKSRMRMDKPFLYFIRHNLSGLILHIGRFNPKNQS